MTALQANQIKVTGIIRSSGLSIDEKQKFDLNNVNYQITDFSKKNEIQNIFGYYLIADSNEDKIIGSLIGQCVEVTGTEPSNWKGINKSDSYLRAVLKLNKIDHVDNSQCEPYSSIPSKDIAGTEKITLRGVVNNSNRPAPDINYDYQVELSKPHLDNDNASGKPQKIILLTVVPDTNNVWMELTNNINQEVEIQGYMEWGYSESKYFRITSIRKIQ